MEKKCKKCKKIKEHRAFGLCDSCYRIKTRIETTFLRRRIQVYVNGHKKELLPQLNEIKNKVLEDCIKNPKKYLKE